MFMVTQDVFDRLLELKREITRKIKAYGSYDFGVIDMEEVQLKDPNDPDELQKKYALSSMLQKLEDVCDELEYLSKPVLDTGKLRRNDNGRFELNGFELTSGCEIEILIVDPEGDWPSYWVQTSIEHDTDYYAVNGHRRLDGLMARYR